MDDFWVYLFAMARSLYAPMRVLRLADQKTPSMGLLEYFVRQADRIIPKYLKEAEEVSKRFMTETMRTVMESSVNSTSTANRDSSEGDSDEESDDDNELDDNIGSDNEA